MPRIWENDSLLGIHPEGGTDAWDCLSRLSGGASQRQHYLFYPALASLRFSLEPNSDGRHARSCLIWKSQAILCLDRDRKGFPIRSCPLLS
jgi:hypothetical protein